jgi:hypothetical protein
MSVNGIKNYYYKSFASLWSCTLYIAVVIIQRTQIVLFLYSVCVLFRFLYSRSTCNRDLGP